MSEETEALINDRRWSRADASSSSATVVVRPFLLFVATVNK